MVLQHQLPVRFQKCMSVPSKMQLLMRVPSTTTT
jgi:hypothetical protein